MNTKHELAAAWTKKRKDAGLCVQCGSKELSSLVLCERCLAQRSARSREEVKRNRSLVLGRYGRACACCGEECEDFLTIDHMHNDGAAHRKALGISSGNTFYRWLIKNKFPAGFQTLCWNCNCAKSRYGYCPHTQYPQFVGDWQLATQAVS